MYAVSYEEAELKDSTKNIKIWIDLDNSPHVPFFIPIVKELEKRGHSVFLTTRDCFQVCSLADYYELNHRKIGKHYGANKLLKILGTIWRSLQLAPTVLREKPDLSLSHGSRSLIILSSLLRIPTILLYDYEYSQSIPFLKPALGIAPEVIDDPHRANHFKWGVRGYSGLKEDVYVSSFGPDPSFLQKLNFKDTDIVATIRPPATEAHYHNPESEKLFFEVVEFFGNTPNVRMVILPRNEKTQRALVYRTWPHWCEKGKIIVPDQAVNGLDLIWHSDLVVSGGGTMNREAAALGVPVYSIFRGKIGAVDRYLAEKGLLTLLETVEDVRSRIRPIKRVREKEAVFGSRVVLNQIVAAIEEVIEKISHVPVKSASPEPLPTNDPKPNGKNGEPVMLIHLVCAARPNFMKVAPLYRALKKERWADPIIVHTGQHYDFNMSDAFFEDLGLPAPDIYLGVKSGTHAEQTGKVMMAYEKVLNDQRPDLVVVVGDVNSTMAATIAASKMGIKVAHLEAGLRSFDRSMPEEINRLVTDVLADMLWTPSRDASENLMREGISPDKIRMVGNVMIDSLEMLRNKIEVQDTYRAFGLEAGGYGVVTLHRPSNVDDPVLLRKICRILEDIAGTVPLVFPIHPRTRRNLEKSHLLSTMESSGKLFLPEPLSYVRFMNLVFNCRFVITDSGGIQEETSYLGIPCLTVRKNTERPITVTLGTNQLCELDDLKQKTGSLVVGHGRKRKNIELWDGKTADRIVELLRILALEIESGNRREHTMNEFFVTGRPDPNVIKNAA